MAVGLEVYNSSGRIILASGLKNLVYMGKGTVSLGSNTSATGTRNTVNTGLPAVAGRYVIFVRSSHNVLILRHSIMFEYFLPQGSTTFTWYAFAYGDGVESGLTAGLQVFDTDGSLMYEIGRPALRLRLIDTSGTGPSVVCGSPTSTENLLETSPAASTFTIAADEAVLYSDPGHVLNGMFPFQMQTVMAYVRYMPTICTDGTTLRMRWGRILPNKSLSGIFGSGTFSHQFLGSTTRPKFALCAKLSSDIL